MRKYKSNDTVRKKAEYLYNKLKLVFLMQDSESAAQLKKEMEEEAKKAAEQPKSGITFFFFQFLL